MSACSFAGIFKRACLCACLLLCACIYSQGNISGVINLYTPVTAISCNQVQVLSAAGFAANDRVLIVQMKGATIDTSNTAGFGNVLNYNNSGNYEFATVAGVTGNTISLHYSLLNAYTVSGLVQLVRVPQYTNVNVSGPLSCMPWNGSTGGVLALEASGMVSLSADVNVNGKGFRGGQGCSNPDGACGSGYTDYYYPVNSGFGAEKGEGIAAISVPKMGGQGALCNGGGGGNKHNSGGGGGGNYTSGGKGGNQASFCPITPVGGEGGRGLNYALHKIFMGGGGGCSDNNNGVGTFGANGGGIIIIRAASLSGNGYTISSGGLSQATIPNNIGDGSGGAGAGGAILLDIPAISGNVSIQSNGGNGGGQNCTYGDCFGDGGGGGIGFIATSAASFPASVNAGSLPGNPGMDTNPGSSCYNTSYGAAGGQTGSGIQTSYTFAEGQTVSGVSVNAGSSATICAGDSVRIGAAAVPGISYSWNPATALSSSSASNPNASPSVTTIYMVTGIPTSGGCTGSGTVQVTVLANPLVSAGTGKAICAGDSAAIGAAPVSGVTYSWNPGSSLSAPLSSQPVAMPASTTVYTVTSTSIQSGCTRSATVQVTVLNNFSINAGNNKLICKGDSTRLGAAAIPGITYAWIPSASLSSASAGDPEAAPAATTIYTVTGTGASGNCSSSATVQVSVSSCDTAATGPGVVIPNIFTPNGDAVNDHFKIAASNISSLHCTIYNRWGQKLYEWTGAGGYWNGNGTNGEKAPEGSYYYIADITDSLGEAGVYRGFLTLMR